MMTISAGGAFLAYEAIRARLPAAVPSNRPPKRVSSLADVADDFDVFLLDAFGVLNIGETAIPETPGRVAALKAAGKRVLVVSNAASVPLADLLGKYRRLGYDFEAEDVITSRLTLTHALAARPNIRWGVMAGTLSDLDDLGPIQAQLLADDPEPYRGVEGFLFIGSSTWTETRQALLEAALVADPRPVLVGNPDVAAPRENGFSAEPGHFAHRLADRTGIAPQFYGKPFANIYELVFQRLGPVDKSRILMVGDSLHTDILGAQSAGITAALVANFGFFAGQDIDSAIALAGIVPDIIVDRP